MIGVFNKRGWMRILEATIAVMIISTTLIFVYSSQPNQETSFSDYIYDVQRQVLTQIYSNSTLRLNVLNTVNDDVSDGNFSELNDYVESKISGPLNYSVRVCDLSSVSCNMDSNIYLYTAEKSVYVEDVIISSELGDGTTYVYNPKLLRLFVWEN